MKQFQECPLCHSHLDYGEKCDCTKKMEQIEEAENNNKLNNIKEDIYHGNNN